MITILQRMCLLSILAILLVSTGTQKAISAAIAFEEPHAPNNHSIPQVDEYVYVCAVDCTNRDLDVGPIGYDFDNTEGTAYGPQVLANEWHAQSQSQALQAGAVAIYTFSKRSAEGCGAIETYYQQNGVSYRVLNNCSQRYWLGSSPDYDCTDQSGQNTITSAHRDAVADTRYETITRPNGSAACAKYFANCGNPTAGNSLESDTLKSIPDPVSSNSAFPTPTPHNSGMSQNGTYAWELNDYAGAAPWDYRQILSHYYSNVNVPNAHNNYRWAWLDVTPDIKFNGSGGENYYGPLTHTPTTMETNQAYQVQMRIKNTGLVPWPNDGSQPVRLSYHWYDTSGADIVTWEGVRTDLDENVDPAEDVTLTAQVIAPSQPGTYVLKWDMVKEGVTWFNQQEDWPTQNVTVNVEWSPRAVFIPDIRSAHNNWVSVMSIRNDSSENTSVTIHLYDTNGDPVETNGYPATYSIASNATLFHSPYFSGLSDWRGSAVVDAGQDVSAVVIQQRYRNGLYSFVSTLGVPADQTTDSLHLPVVMRDFDGWETAFRVQNVGSQGTAIRATYYYTTGVQAGYINQYRNANGSIDFDQGAGDHSFLGSGFNGSTEVTALTSGAPLAVHLYETHQTGSELFSYGGFSSGSQTLYLPILHSYAYGGSWSTSFSLKNVASGTANVTIEFINENGSTHCTDVRSISASFSAWLPQYPGSSCAFPDGWVGSARISSDRDLAGIVNQINSATGSDLAATYSALGTGSTTGVLPYLPRNVSGWSSSFTLQNLGNAQTEVTYAYYRADGSVKKADNTVTLAAGASASWHLPDVSGLSNEMYTVVAASDGQPIGAIANTIGSGTGDRFTSYNGRNY